ncbi:MAG TPA: DUF4189 domain-containing protein [Xanthobacteraceae bacterium]|jgi:hypothetical protein|nr:DUF4189 domain-containing protein [Xanthobacteraceae bacterium]
MQTDRSRQWKKVALVAAVLLALAPRTGTADGALAVGMPADVAREGFAYGSALGAANMDAARTAAIDGCRGALGNASAALRKLCKVVATFRDQCFAVAMDPKDGTPGVGWAIAENQRMADRQAIEQCRTTAGASRRDFCTLDVQPGARSRGCDGAAK